MGVGQTQLPTKINVESAEVLKMEAHFQRLMSYVPKILTEPWVFASHGSIECRQSTVGSTAWILQ